MGLRVGVNDCKETVCALEPRTLITLPDYKRIFVMFNHPDKGGLLTYSTYFNECKDELFSGGVTELSCASVERGSVSPAVREYERHRESRQFKLYGKVHLYETKSKAQQQNAEGDHSSQQKRAHGERTWSGNAQHAGDGGHGHDSDDLGADPETDMILSAGEFVREHGPAPFFHFEKELLDFFEVGANLAAQYIGPRLQPIVDALDTDLKRWREVNDGFRVYKRLGKEVPASAQKRESELRNKYGSIEQLENALSEGEYHVRAFKKTDRLGADWSSYSLWYVGQLLLVFIARFAKVVLFICFYHVDGSQFFAGDLVSKDVRTLLATLSLVWVAQIIVSNFSGLYTWIAYANLPSSDSIVSVHLSVSH